MSPPIPRPSRLAPRKWASSTSRAARAPKAPPSTRVSGMPGGAHRATHPGSALWAIRISAGRRSSAVSSSALPAPGSSPTQKSPVETSTSATPTAEDVAWAASRKLLRAPSRNWVSVIVPGVMTRTTSRRTILRPLAGSSSCSHTATFWPARMRRAM